MSTTHTQTPRTEAEAFWSEHGGMVVSAKAFAQLERELAAANERIRRLTEAGDVMALCLTGHEPFRSTCISKWTKAKEAKL